MKQSQGWAQIIRFDALKPIDPDTLSPTQQVEHQVCAFCNSVIDVFNTQPLGIRLLCVAKLFMMVQGLALMALLATVRKLPYVEPNRFDTIKDGHRLPVFHFTEELP